MKRTSLSLISILALFSAAVWSEESSDLQQKYAAFEKLVDTTVGEPDSLRDPKIRKKYDSLFSSKRYDMAIGDIKDESLRLLFRAANTAAFYTDAPEYTRDMEFYFAELQKRGIARKSDQHAMYGAYIAARKFDKVASFAEKFGSKDLEQTPRFYEDTNIRSDAPTLMRLDNMGRSLRRESVDLSSGIRIVIVSHPSCHFSVDAVEDIEANPVINSAIARAIWLAPQDRKLSFNKLQAWNREHPDKQFSIAYRQSEWPMLDDWATPNFYFFNDGELIDHITGWPSEGRMDELEAVLGQLGLLDPDVGDAEESMNGPNADK